MNNMTLGIQLGMIILFVAYQKDSVSTVCRMTANKKR